MKKKKALKMLSALSQDTRLNIFKLLIQENQEGLSAGVIADILQVPSATMSFHLSQLTDAGLLRSTKKGRIVMYAAKHKSVKNLMIFLTENAYKKNQKAAPNDIGMDDDDDSED
jgi:ArsR family transcriptional regulator